MELKVIDLSQGRDFLDMALTAIDLCRSGDWDAGLPQLSYVAKYENSEELLPGVFYSCLGYGLAKHEEKYKEGLGLCRTGVERSVFEAETHLYLAKTYMLIGWKKAAIVTLDRGLRVAPEDKELLKMRGEFGWRKPLAVSSLPRSHFVNRVAGELKTLGR